MLKLLKILGRSVSISVEWILIMSIVFLFAIRIPSVQTFLGKQATYFLSAEMDAEISVGAIEIVFFDRVYLKDVSVIDPNAEQLLFVSELKLQMDHDALIQNDIAIASIVIDKGEMHIIRAAKDGTYNFQFLIDYFEQPDSEESVKSKLSIASLSIKDMDLTYNDLRKDTVQYGVDYNHMQFSNLYLDLFDFKLEGSNITSVLESLSFKEKSGISLSSMNGDFAITDQELQINDLEFSTVKSSLSFPQFKFSYEDWNAFSNFTSEVLLDIKLNPSEIALDEVGLFVPEIKGMDAVLKVTSEIKNPVTSLELSKTEIRLGTNTFLEGDFKLPDFTSELSKDLRQFVRSAYIDLNEIETLKLPIGVDDINLESFINHRFISLAEVEVNGGFKELDITFSSLSTTFGTIRMPEAYVLKILDSGLSFEAPKNSRNPLIIQQFSLDAFVSEDVLGRIKGAVYPSLLIDNDGSLSLNVGKSTLTRFDLNGYAVKDVILENLTLKNEYVDFELTINDPNLKVNAEASIGISNQNYKGSVQIEGINLDALNFTIDSSFIIAAISLNLDGNPELDWGGAVEVNNLSYYRGNDTLKTDALALNIDSDEGLYAYQLQSEFFDADLDGKFSWVPLLNNFYSDLAVIFPSLKVGLDNEQDIDAIRDNHLVEFSIRSKSADSLLNFFLSDIRLDSASNLKGSYNAYSHDLDLDVNISKLLIGDLSIDGLTGEQQLHSDSIFADYLIDHISFKDSLRFNLIEFYTFGSDGLLESQLSWDPVSDRYSKIDWETNIHDNDHVEILLKPSFFSLESYRWEIVNESDISITSEDIHIEQFELSREGQNIKMNGCLSENDFDQLYVYTRNVDVSEISSILGLDRSLEGLLSGWSVFSNPYSNFNYIGDLSLKQFHLAKESIGDVWLRTGWNNEMNAVELRGELKVDNHKTFNILGSYFVKRKDLDLDLMFDNTDVSFLNALVDPDVINNISGDLDGLLEVHGPWNAPIIQGALSLDKVHAKVELLGVDYYLDGVIDVQESLFALNNVPFSDPEGNTGSVIGSVFHDNFQNWSFDIQLNFEDDISKRQTTFPFGFEPLKQFLILDTEYKDGDSYFGKAYGRGNANISGYGENMNITLNVLTQENTILNFPMYGSSDIDEDYEFVNFRSNLALDGVVEKRFDFTGLDLDLNFNLDPKAKLNIIFDPSSGDQIQAYGSGNINMKLNPFYEIDLNGTYTISEGSTYNFAMGLIKQNFEIQKGSTISWTGDPYNADIDLVTSFSIPKVSLKDLAPELVMSDQESRQMKNQKIDCFLNLNETLLAPQISFDIQAANAPETGKALLNEVISEESELSKQFFSLLLLRSFQPLNSSIEAHASAAKDLAESQVNALLGDVSQEYDLNFSSVVDKDLIGLDLIEFGISRRFFNDRLIISGNFGLEEDSTSSSSESSYIPVGDLFVEYLINESGTFRATAFREADPYNVGTDESGQKPYTQGAGISYQEDFTNIKDFKLIQYFFDIFRPKNRRRYLGRNKNKLTAIDS